MRRPPHPAALAVLITACTIAWGAPSAPAQRSTRQPETLEDRAERQRLASIASAAAAQAFADRDYRAAKRHLEDQIRHAPQSFVAHYNMACALSKLDDLDAAEDHLSQAIGYGFSDLHQLRRDDYLAPLRDRELYNDLLRGWPLVLDARKEANITRDEQLVPRKRERRTLDPLRLEIISAHDPTATSAAVGELEALGEWLHQNVFPTITEEPWHSHHPWVNVVLPDPDAFNDWQIVTFGPESGAGFSTIGGAYDHDRKRLVSKDLGATLRHEFVHVLHWRDMSRTGQRHAMWVQEGIAALVEDYDVSDAGFITPVPSWRTNMVKRLLDARRLQTLEQLAGTELDRFSASKPLAKYAHARAVFLFLNDHGAIPSFFREYEATYRDDPTGLTALRRALAVESQDQLEDQFRAWVAALPDVPETGDDLTATLGVEIEEGTGDGPKVVRLPSGARERTGLRLGSVITAIDARPTRDMHELIRILGDYAPGDTVTLHHRRGRIHKTSDVRLLPRE
ncbi:MAG: hypothetical protein RIB32_01750 [Phycisphaerales bacterium]